jgi:hypothetical protein
MQIGGVRPGDVVKCERGGMQFFAEVVSKEKGRLEIAPLQKHCTYREVTSRQVLAHYRKAKGSQV